MTKFLRAVRRLVRRVLGPAPLRSGGLLYVSAWTVEAGLVECWVWRSRAGVQHAYTLDRSAWLKRQYGRSIN